MKRVVDFRLLLCALACVVIGGLVGCHYPGGPGWSADRSTYHSTEFAPKTVTLTDTRTGAEIWAVDIPVGSQLVVGFSRGTGPNAEYPDEVVWGLMPLGQRSGTRDLRQAVPGKNVRLLEMKLRATPESPGEAPHFDPFDRARGWRLSGAEALPTRGASGGD